jgi:hypothetical protein
MIDELSADNSQSISYKIFPNYSKKIKLTKMIKLLDFVFLLLRARVIINLLSERSEDNILIF